MANPPRQVIDAARRAPAMRVAGSTVADIAYDSALDDSESQASQRRITFVADGLEVGLVVRPAGENLELSVELHPAIAATIRTFDGEPRTLHSTDAARLTVKPGMTSLVIEPATLGANVVQTAWVSL
ncbi:MAG TPA: hypothetical protein VFG63_02525 [Nocardioidaceae bacterium]|nr:hypothetical protein [Nocardioidaceae bacterium]